MKRDLRKEDAVLSALVFVGLSACVHNLLQRRDLKAFAERSASILQRQTFKIPGCLRYRHLSCGISLLAARSCFVPDENVFIRFR